jgi:hypothetical protein
MSRPSPCWGQVFDAIRDELIEAANNRDEERTDVLLDLLRDVTDVAELELRPTLPCADKRRAEHLLARLPAILSGSRLASLGFVLN